MYRCECKCPAGFIQQLAVSYVSNGYFFYVVGTIPTAKDPARTDAKLIERYEIDQSKWSRARRKRRGGANVQYLRLGRQFVLLATHGHHPFFELEGDRVRDLRRVPLKVLGYAVSHKRGRVHLRIERETFKGIWAHLRDLAVHRSAAALRAEFSRLAFEPYAPVRRQLLQLLRAVNRARKAAGLERVPLETLRFRRRIQLPFGGPGPSQALQPSGGGSGLQYDPAGGLEGGDSEPMPSTGAQQDETNDYADNPFPARDDGLRGRRATARDKGAGATPRA